MLADVMKITKRSVVAHGNLTRFFLVAGAVVLWVPLASRGINAVTPDGGAGQQAAAAGQTTPGARYSPGFADIVRMADAKVDPEVIKTYVKNSPTAYNPSATEIIALRDRGVAPEILTAMLQHGAEVRAQSMQAAQAAPGAVAPPPYPGAANPYGPAPSYDYGAQAVYPNYSYSYPDYSYAYSPYGYSFPGYNYGWCNYGYPWPYGWPSFGFGLGCYPYGRYCGYPYGRYGFYGRGFYGFGAHHGAFAGSRGGFHSFGGGARSASFASHGGGFRAGGGFGGHAVSMGGHGGGFGGHGGGRGR
jgi:hypothetical protein